MKKILVGILIGVLITLIGLWAFQTLIEKNGNNSSTTGIEGFEITNQPKKSDTEEKEEYPYLGKLTPTIADLEGLFEGFDISLTDFEWLIELRYKTKIFIWDYDNKIHSTLDVRVTNLSNQTIRLIWIRMFITDVNGTFRKPFGNAPTDLLMGIDEWQRFELRPGQILYRHFFSGAFDDLIPLNASIEELRIEVVVLKLQFS